MDFREPLRTSLGDAYSLERELPAGGMSRVFVAEEIALRRRVVVKVVPAETAAQVSIDRFKREIAFVARLQHPHIVPLLTAGESGGMPYFTMPFVEGESLRARLERSGELPVQEAVRILREVATALEYAHERGIVHRDIKPENVLLAGSGGIAMVADFGVAKAIAAAKSGSERPEGATPRDLFTTALTEVGIGLGTPAYMSPEQAAADSTIDHRADIYSFGVLAYEVLIGSPPFVGRTLPQLLAAQVSEVPVAVAARRPSLPPALSLLVMQCLEKRPADRRQSATEIVRALDDLAMPSGVTQPGAASGTGRNRTRAHWSPSADLIAGLAIVVAAILIALALFARRVGQTASARAAAAPSIAVLPFENRSGDSNFDYIAEGMSDELRSDLTRFRGLAVKGGSSSRQFGGHAVDVRRAGERLGAGSIIMGTVNRSGGRLRVTAELVNVANEDAVWSRTFDTPLADLPAIQSSIASAIAGALRVSLESRGADSAQATAPRATSDVEAYDLYLQGRYAEHRHRVTRALDLYNAAIRRDSSFAQAYAGLARVFIVQADMGVGSRDSALARARRAAARAEALGPRLPDVYRAKLVVEWFAGDFRAADNVSEQLLAAYPGDAESHEPRALTLGLIGRPGAAVVEARKAELLDPLDPRTLMTLGYALLTAGNYVEAIAKTRLVFELGPGPENGVVAYQQIGDAYAFLGKADSAVATFETAMRTDSTVYGMRAYLMFGYAAAGRWKEARAQRALLEHEAASGNSPNFLRTIIHETFGQIDSAVVDLTRAVESVEPLYTFNDVSCDPMFDALKADRRYTALMASKGVAVCPPRVRWPIGAPR
jgi:serine/threonine-protein kinase